VSRAVSRADLAVVAAMADRLAALLGAGLPVVEAWQALAQAGDQGTVAEIATVVERVVRSGGSVPEGLRLAASPGQDDGGLAWLATTWALLDGCGAAPAGVLASVAGSLRAEREARAAVEIASAGPRATVWILVAMPLAALGFGQTLGAEPLRVLVGSASGRCCLVLGCVLWAVGLLWARRLIR
jgi:tight adherence protein B